MPCLIKLEADKVTGKLELISIINELMPAGRPRYLDMIKYPKITALVEQYGRATLLKALFLLIKDFCGSINVVRNMNEDQMIETAAMLLDECDNYRLEDYTMMFAMAKRGEIGNIFDHVDIQVISKIHDEYHTRRIRAAQEARDGYISRLDSIGNTNTQRDLMNPQDRKMNDGADKLAASIESIRMGMTDHDMKREPIDDQIKKAADQIEKK